MKAVQKFLRHYAFSQPIFSKKLQRCQTWHCAYNPGDRGRGTQCNLQEAQAAVGT